MSTDDGARSPYRLMLILMLWVWFGTVLAVNLPGHLTHDSLTQIAEGRSGIVQSWNPVFSSWIFGTLVNWTGGTEVLVALSASLLATAVYLIAGTPAVPADAQSQGWMPSLVVVALLLFTPILIVHPGVVWKDVWFAHFALVGFGLTVVRARGGGIWSEALALTCFAAAMLSRQTGVLVAAVGVAALAVCRTSIRPEGVRGPAWLRPAWAVVWRMALMVGLAFGLGQAAREGMRQIQAAEVGTGLKLVAMFDMAGVLQREPRAELLELRSKGFETRAWEASARATFSAERIDRLELQPFTGPRDLSLGDLLGQWAQLVAAHPLAYLAHRVEVFSWFSGLREQARCIPIHVGVEAGPQTPNAGLTLQTPRMSPILYGWSRGFVDTPYFAPLAWNGVSLLVIVLYLWRRAWRDPIVALQVAGLIYSLSYLMAGLSCDFRYSYFSVVAASIGLMRVLADGPDYWMRRV